MNKEKLKKEIDELMGIDCNINWIIEDINAAKEAEQSYTYHFPITGINKCVCIDNKTFKIYEI